MLLYRVLGCGLLYRPNLAHYITLRMLGVCADLARSLCAQQLK